MSPPVIAVFVLWAVWLVSWLLARGWSNATIARGARAGEIVHTLVVNAGWALMFVSVFHRLGPRLWVLPAAAAWSLVIVASLGFALCWWARWRLGRNWSWGVTLKESHVVVDTGPYRFTRHPIYLGLLIAGAATVALEAKAAAVAGYAAVAAGLWYKARLEERFLRSRLGEQSYGVYASRTGMMLPKL